MGYNVLFDMTSIPVSALKVNSGEENSPAAPAGIQTRNISIASPALLPTSYPGPLIRCPSQPRVTAAARKRPRSVCQKCRWQVAPKHTYILDPMKSEWADCRCPGIVWEPILKRAHKLVREHSAAVVSAC